MVAFIWRSGKVMWRAALRGRFPPFCHFTIGHMKTKRSKKSALLRLMAIIMRLLAKCFGEMARLYGEAQRGLCTESFANSSTHFLSIFRSLKYQGLMGPYFRAKWNSRKKSYTTVVFSGIQPLYSRQA